MNKSDLANIIAADYDLPKAKAGAIVDAITGRIASEVAAGNTVTLVGFGTFKASQRAARDGRNPATGEAIKIAASTVPKFTPGKEFKDIVNANGAKPKKGKK